MNPPPRRILTPSWASNKRKDRDTTAHKPTVQSSGSAQAVRIPPEPSFDFLKPANAKPTSSAHLIRRQLKPDSPHLPRSGSGQAVKKPSEPGPSNILLAGYLAHEFLTNGTLMGEKWDPARAQAVPLESHQKRAVNQKAEPSGKVAELKEMKHQRYREVANLMKTEGARIQGIVNPTELGRFLYL